ncbi:MAG: chemotaxis protein CheW [Pirellulaceae bacterium]|nr:chemotaxis protein CheW [Pirellulaceae bacterium]
MTGSSTPIRAAQTTVLAVRLGTHRYAFPIEAVEEVLPALPIDAVPECPDFVLGVVFVRGRSIPVLDAAERLGFKGHKRPDEPPIVCVRVGGRLVGVEVDETIDLMEIRLDPVLAADGSGSREGVLSGLVECDGQVIRILNLDKLIAEEVWSACP